LRVAWRCPAQADRSLGVDKLNAASFSQVGQSFPAKAGKMFNLLGNLASPTTPQVGVLVRINAHLSRTTQRPCPIVQALASLDTGALRCVQEMEVSGYADEVGDCSACLELFFLADSRGKSGGWGKPLSGFWPDGRQWRFTGCTK
jgi:hypothetical protein